MQLPPPTADRRWRLTSVLVGTLAVFTACNDQQVPTRPAVARCASGVATNTGSCVPALSRMAPPITRDVVPTTTSGTFTTFDIPDASWTGTTSLIDISGLTNFSAYSAVSDANLTVTFGSAMTKVQAAVSGGGWATWSCPPYAETCAPHALWGIGTTSNTLTLSKPVYAFGFEIEPNPFQVEPISVSFVLMSGPTVVGVINRSIDGNGGARLVAGRSTVAFDQVAITSQADFAIAQIRYSLNTDVATQTVPAGQPATVTVVQNNEPVAGISVPTNGFAEDVVLTVSLSPPSTGLPAAAAAMCHAYLLNQTGQCLTVTAIRTSDGQHAITQQPVTVGVCLPAVLHVEFFKFENTQDRPMVLQQVPAGFLPCDAAVHHASAAPPSNWLDGFAQALVKQVGGLLTPKPLYAGHFGFGGVVPPDAPLSIFTWAAPVPITSAGLAVNVLNSGNDGFALAGTFTLPTTGFDAMNDAVTVGFGTSVYTIPANSFRWVAPLKRWAYAGKYATGINAMTINPVSGAFTVAATLPTEGPAPTGTSTIFRPFSIQIGQRAQGVGLKCGATGICLPQETP